MEYPKIIHLLENTPKKPGKFRKKNWVKKMMNQEKHTILIAKLNSKQQCLSLVYVIIVKHIYLLKEI